MSLTNVDNKISHAQEESSGGAELQSSSMLIPTQEKEKKHWQASIVTTEGESAENAPPQQTTPHLMLQASAPPQLLPQAFPSAAPFSPPVLGQQFSQPSTLAPTTERGWIPNIVRKAVPLEDLREHPNFHELPHPSQVQIQCLQHLSLYRKDSWQYTNLIKGRLNCCQLASLLGFYEEKYARSLKIPEGRIGHSHARDVWEALRVKRITDFGQLQRIARNPRFRRQTSKWKRTNRGVWMFTYEPHKHAALKQYRDLTSGRQHNANHPTVQWQRAHDPVGLLAAVNMFGKLGAKIKEVGMLPMEAVGIPMHFNVQRSRLDVGSLSASPQAIIEWYNGTIEVLSVVSKCPFERVQIDGPNQKPQFSVVARDPEQYIPPWMYPQIQFQIYCAGIKTTSAIVIFYSPTGGMNLFRVAKCQAYVDLMLTFVHVFQKQWADAPPPENFFVDFPGYDEFCSWTIDLATKIPMLSHIQPELVQTSPLDHPSNTSWFLDNVQNPYLNQNNNRNQRDNYNNSGRGNRRRNFQNNNNQRYHRRNRRNNNHNQLNTGGQVQAQVNQQGGFMNNYPPNNSYPPNNHFNQQDNHPSRGRRNRKKGRPSNNNSMQPNQFDVTPRNVQQQQPAPQYNIAPNPIPALPTEHTIVPPTVVQSGRPGEAGPGWDVDVPAAAGESKKQPELEQVVGTTPADGPDVEPKEGVSSVPPTE